MSQKIILVTGGTGLVGYAIKSISNDYNYNFIFANSKDCDLCNYEETFKYFESIKPSICIHLAANVGGLLKNMNNKVSMLEKNLIMNYNVVKCCHEFKVEKAIFCLSTCIFPDKITYPIDETMLHLGPPHTSNDAYAYAKRMLEIHVKQYIDQGDNFVCIIPTNIYGPNDNYSLENGHVIPSLIHKCYLAKKNNTPFVIGGTGKPLRQFINSIDLAKLIIFTMENLKNGNIILSVPPQDETSIKTIGELIAKEFDYQNILFDDTIPDGQYKKTASNTKLLALLNKDFKFTPIDVGLRETIKSFVENYNNCRK